MRTPGTMRLDTVVRRLALALILLATAAPAAADDGARNTPPQRKVSQVDVFGDDPCPKGVGDEIVVCARKPESERFRIPAPIRQQQKNAARKDQSWVARTRDIDETGRATMPDSCSPVGSGGQTGCTAAMFRDYAAQRKADAAAKADEP